MPFDSFSGDGSARNEALLAAKVEVDLVGIGVEPVGLGLVAGFGGPEGVRLCKSIEGVFKGGWGAMRTSEGSGDVSAKCHEYLKGEEVLSHSVGAMVRGGEGVVGLYCGLNDQGELVQSRPRTRMASSLPARETLLPYSYAMVLAYARMTCSSSYYARGGACGVSPDYNRQGAES